jgi:hypothetical protein
LKKKYGKIIKVKDVPRVKSLIDVRWIFKLKYKKGFLKLGGYQGMRKKPVCSSLTAKGINPLSPKRTRSGLL